MVVNHCKHHIASISPAVPSRIAKLDKISQNEICAALCW